MERVPLLRIEWRPVAVPAPAPSGGWRVEADRGGVGDDLARHLPSTSGPLAGWLFTAGLDAPDTAAGAIALAAQATEVVRRALEASARAEGFRLWVRDPTGPPDPISSTGPRRCCGASRGGSPWSIPSWGSGWSTSTPRRIRPWWPRC